VAEHQPEQPMHSAANMAEAMEHVRQHAGSPPRMVTNKEIRQGIHGQGLAGRFNNRLASLVTTGVGTMWAAYVFAAIALVSLPDAIRAFQEGNILVAVGWLSTSFLQLVLLPIIIVGQNVISAHQDARAETDHETLTTLYSINLHQLKILETQAQILNALEEQTARA
jgi:flagellar biosynthesis GTPase FlhF